MPREVVFLLVDRLGDNFDRLGERLLGVFGVRAGDESDVVANVEHREFLTTDIVGLEIILGTARDRRDKADRVLAWQLGDVAEFVVDFGAWAATARAARSGAAARGVAAITGRFAFVTRARLLWFGMAGGHAADDLLGTRFFGGSVDFVFDHLFEFEGGEFGVDSRAVKKEIGPTASGLDKAESLFGVERAYFSGEHFLKAECGRRRAEGSLMYYYAKLKN